MSNNYATDLHVQYGAAGVNRIRTLLLVLSVVGLTLFTVLPNDVTVDVTSLSADGRPTSDISVSIVSMWQGPEGLDIMAYSGAAMQIRPSNETLEPPKWADQVEYGETGSRKMVANRRRRKAWMEVPFTSIDARDRCDAGNDDSGI